MTEHMAVAWLTVEAARLMRQRDEMHKTGGGWKVGSPGWLQQKNFLDGQLLMVETVARTLFGAKVGREARVDEAEE